MYGHYGAYGWGAWMVVAMIVWPLVLAAAIWGMVAVTGGGRRQREEAPEETLKQRFARGDISQQEYLDARAILKNGGNRSVHGA